MLNTIARFAKTFGLCMYLARTPARDPFTSAPSLYRSRDSLVDDDERKTFL